MPRPEIVHPVGVEHVEGWTHTFATTLFLHPFGDELATMVHRSREAWEPHRSWGVRDRGRWVATLATNERTITVPGAGIGTRDLTADALTAVTVAGTHRRRGLLTRMLTGSLQEARDRGDALSILIAAEWPIYGRFGYAPATLFTKYRYLPRQGGPIRGGDPTRVRQIDAAEVASLGPGVHDRARRLRAGQVDRPGSWWDRRVGLDGRPARVQQSWFAHEAADGGCDGLVSWSVGRQFDINGPLTHLVVGELVTASDDAYVDLWAYLGGLDTVEQIELDLRPPDEPIRWRLADGRALKQSDSCDALWVRLLDVPAALSARGYAVDGDVVLEVVDEQGGFAAGRYRLLAADGEATCVLTDAPADLRIDQRVLASIYLGGHLLAQLALAGGVEELTPGAAARVGTMFATPLPPWTQTHF